jgi:hypothetical protein
MVRRKRQGIHPLFHFTYYSYFLFEIKIEIIEKYCGYYGLHEISIKLLNKIKDIQTKWCAAIQTFCQIVSCLLWIMMTFSYIEWKLLC